MISPKQPSFDEELESGRRGGKAIPVRGAEEDGEEDEDSDGDEEGGEAGVVPFPKQKDPAKPLRPKHYRQKKAQRNVKRWFDRNHGLMLVALAQVFYR